GMSHEPSSSGESLPLSAEKRVDEVCDRFEAAWRAGRKPRIEEYVITAPQPERAALLRQLLSLEVELRRQCGEASAAAQYTPRFPAHAAIIADLFRGPSEPRDLRARTFDARSTLSQRVVLDRADFPALAKYEILAEAGHGGMGVVYRARHKFLGKQ